MKSHLISGIVTVGVFALIAAFSFVAPQTETPSGEMVLIPRASIMPIGWAGSDSASNNSAYVAVPKASLMPAPWFGFAAAKAATKRDEKAEALPAKAAIPAALAGTWRNGDIATVDFYDAQTGVWQNEAAEGMFLSIQPNGEYRLGSVESIYLNGSEARHQLYQEGKAVIIGKQLVLQPTSGYTEVRENCAPQRNGESQVSANDLAASAFAFEIVAENNVPYRPTLVLTSETGEKITLAVDGL
jgi:hypothetical protein